MSSNHPSIHVKWVTEVTVWVWRRTGHASQTIVVYPHTGSTTWGLDLCQRDEHPAYTLYRSMALLYLYLATWIRVGGGLQWGEISGQSPICHSKAHTHTVHTYCVLFVCVWTQIASSKYTLFLLPLFFLLFLLFDGVIFFLPRNE